MRILHVTLSNIGGGAAKIARTLHSELLTRGVDSQMIVIEGEYDKNSIVLGQSKSFLFFFRLKNYISNLVSRIYTNKSKDYRSINIFRSSLLNHINSAKADIVHLHWIGAEMLSIKQISQINSKVIWTLHDAWPLNGSYHINPKDYDPSISIIDGYTPDKSNLLERSVLKRKIKYLKNITFTSPSTWLLNKYHFSNYRESNNTCVHIPNFIDLSLWKPVDKTIARKKLNIKTSKILLTIGSSSDTSCLNKGFHFIEELLKILSPEKYGIIFFGNDSSDHEFKNTYECYELGRLNSITQLRTAYSAGDITIVPSMSESFSLVSLESIACNTPVLAFNTSGIIDIVKHKENGFLSKRFDIESLRSGIEWLSNSNLANISNTIKGYSQSKVVSQFEDLYLETINR